MSSPCKANSTNGQSLLPKLALRRSLQRASWTLIRVQFAFLDRIRFGGALAVLRARRLVSFGSGGFIKRKHVDVEKAHEPGIDQ